MVPNPSRRDVLKATLLAGVSRQCFAIGAGVVTSSTSTAQQVTTLTLVNDSASTVPAGVPTKTIGLLFADSDTTGIPVSKAPRFVVSGVNQGYSYGLIRRWPSGRIMRMTVMIMPTFSTAGSGSTAIQVWNDGAFGASYNATSSRTLTEVYANGYSVSAPPAAIHGAGGTYGAWVDTNANINNNQYISPNVLLDGQAGKMWEIFNEMSLTKTGSAHGQLRCKTFFTALNDSSGNLGGFRAMSFIRMPKYNNDTPAKNYYAFSGISWNENGNNHPIPFPFQPMTFTPNVPANPYSAVITGMPTFTGSISNNILTAGTPSATIIPGMGLTWSGVTTRTFIGKQLTGTAGGAGTYKTFQRAGNASYGFPVTQNQSSIAMSCTNPIWMGADSNGSQICGYFTTTGTLPPEINTTSIWNLTSDQGASNPPLHNDVNIAVGVRGNGGISFSTPGTGQHTFNPCNVLLQFTRISTANADAEDNFFVGTGSLSSESTLRPQFDQTYWQSTKVIQPQQLGISTFQGYINGSTINVTSTPTNNIFTGMTLVSGGATAGTAIVNYLIGGGTGGTGAYQVNISQTLGSAGSPVTFTTQFTGASFLTGGQVADTELEFDYNQYNITNFLQANHGTGGEYDDLGIVPNLASCDFYNQSFDSYKQIRIGGLSACLYNYDFKDKTTDTVLNFSANSYTGLPTTNGASSIASTVCLGNDSPAGIGFNAPPDPDGSTGSFAIQFLVSDTEHQHHPCVWAFLRTGHPAYLDFVKEWSVNSVLQSAPIARNPTVRTGQPYFLLPGGADALGNAATGLISLGVLASIPPEYRTTGWAIRSMAWGNLTPFDPTNPNTLDYDGTQTGKMIRDLSLLQTQYAVATMNPSNSFYGSSTTYITNRGLMLLYAPDGSGGTGQNNYTSRYAPWEFGYFMKGVGIMASLLGDSNALQILQYGVNESSYVLSNFGGFHMYSYYARTANPNIGPTQVPIARDADWAIVDQTTLAGGTTWVVDASPGPSSRAFTMNAPINNGYTIKNNDRIMFYDGTTTPAGFTNEGGPYYLVNVSGSTFNLSASQGGSPIATTDSGTSLTGGDGWFIDSSPQAATTGAFPGFEQYIPDVWSQICMAKALGATGCDPILNDAFARNVANNWNYAGDARTAYQDHFGP